MKGQNSGALPLIVTSILTVMGPSHRQSVRKVKWKVLFFPVYFAVAVSVTVENFRWNENNEKKNKKKANEGGRSTFCTRKVDHLQSETQYKSPCVLLAWSNFSDLVGLAGSWRTLHWGKVLSLPYTMPAYVKRENPQNNKRMGLRNGRGPAKISLSFRSQPDSSHSKTYNFCACCEKKANGGWLLRGRLLLIFADTFALFYLWWR